MNKFWMVWNEAKQFPRKKHLSFGGAKTEAERLARKHPGEEFHVLELSGTAIKHGVEWKTPRQGGMWFAVSSGD